MPPLQYATPKDARRKVWFHGYSYHTTPGSRTAFSVAATDTIYNGYPFCFDPEAYTDRASLPSGMTIKGEGENAMMFNVTKPATGILGLFAGVVVGLPSSGLAPDEETHTGRGYQGGVELELVYSADLAKAFVLGDMSSAGYETALGCVDAQWYLGILAASTAANNQLIVGRPLIRTNVAAAAKHPVSLGPCGRFAA